ncbi:uncharacterized protein TrAtP1_010494 [Trichoderma atroviride]|uniref:uncharacterized protein n=1 Tax=Hypocrea atroviridis TaxID=63577 RepID=UPI00331DF73D|nr:hypothetical protein TrAtP1_010494 [Trichoderma atroviride]
MWRTLDLTEFTMSLEWFDSNHLSSRSFAGYNTWTCGLWCLGFVHTIVELQPERMCGYLDLVNLIQGMQSIVGHSFHQVQKDRETSWISVGGRKPEPLLGHWNLVSYFPRLRDSRIRWASLG